MRSVNVNIQPKVIHWALSQTPAEKLGEKLMDNITKWLDGTKTPTFHQIEEFSKKSNIPLGYFFLQTPPTEQPDLLEYRTIDSVQLIQPSRDLLDTIHEMENIQEWMKAYRQDLGFDRLVVVGSMSDAEDANHIADRIRQDLELDETWYEKSRSARESFSHIRSQLEKCGVLVMMSGIVGKNTHRRLDVNEFRAFAMCDDWAPLLFINSADSNTAKLFSLLHEVAHIWIGKSDLFNDRQGRTMGVRKSETLCNAVAGELLVPRNVFLARWNHTGADVQEKISQFAQDFRCGEIVIARKALDYNKIKPEIYHQVVQTSIAIYNRVKTEKEAKGGDYYNTMGSRLDGCFVRALCESISLGRTTYTEAYRLTNTSRQTEVDRRQAGGLV